MMANRLVLSDGNIRIDSIFQPVLVAERTTDLDFGATTAASPTTITFDSPVGGDGVNLDAFGNLTFSQAGAYAINLEMFLGRPNSGGEAFVLFRFIVSGTPQTPKSLAFLDDGDNYRHVQVSIANSFIAGESLRMEIWTDDGFSKDGELLAQTIAVPAVTVAPAAALSVSRFFYNES